MTESHQLISEISNFLEYDDSGEILIETEAFDLVDKFVEKYFHLDFGKIIIDAVDEHSDLAKIARFLDILIWSTPDNGKKLDIEIFDWILSTDKRKVEIILLREDDFPRNSKNENIEALEVAKKNFPELKNLCDYFVNEFDYHEKNHKRRMAIFYEIRKTIGYKKAFT